MCSASGKTATRRKAAVVRLALFGALTVIGGVAVIALSGAGGDTIHYGLGEQASVETAEWSRHDQQRRRSWGKRWGTE